MSLDITQDILTQAVAEVTEEYGRVNLSALGRRLPLTREQLKRLKRNGFITKPNGNLGKHREKTKLSGFEEIIDSYLRKGITNSQVIFDSIKRRGFSGGLTIVKGYIKAHEDLVPAPRILAIESPNRGRRYETGPGEMFQMDWGFVRVEDEFGQSWQCACFAMVCHHCGLRYIEFFPSARQENLFIGMLHAFIAMGVPKSVLTDNMKSVVVKRLCDGSPVWNKEYDAFQKLVGIQTKLCKVAHPFTKGKVGYCKFNREETLLFFQLVDRVSLKETGSIVLTSNKDLSQWVGLFDEDDALECTIDRLWNKAICMTFSGISHRGTNREQVELNFMKLR